MTLRITLIGKKIQSQDSHNINDSDSDDDKLDLDSEANYSKDKDGDEGGDQIEVPLGDIELAATTKIVDKGRGQNLPCIERQRIAKPVDSYSSATSISGNWKEAIETITLSCYLLFAMQRMLESLRLLGS